MPPVVPSSLLCTTFTSIIIFLSSSPVGTELILSWRTRIWFFLVVFMMKRPDPLHGGFKVHFCLLVCCMNTDNFVCMFSTYEQIHRNSTDEWITREPKWLANITCTNIMLETSLSKCCLIWSCCFNQWAVTQQYVFIMYV